MSIDLASPLTRDLERAPAIESVTLRNGARIGSLQFRMAVASAGDPSGVEFESGGVAQDVANECSLMMGGGIPPETKEHDGFSFPSCQVAPFVKMPLANSRKV